MALELKDLNADERLALVTLLQLVVEADRYASDPEASKLRGVVAALGKKDYLAAAEQSDGRFEDRAELRRFLQGIERQDARELIYGTVMDLALAEVPVASETEILDWLKRTWHIETRIEDA